MRMYEKKVSDVSSQNQNNQREDSSRESNTMFGANKLSDSDSDTEHENDNNNDNSSDSDSNEKEMDEIDKINQYLQSIEVAAFTHMVQWSESASIIKKKLLLRNKALLLHTRKANCMCCPRSKRCSARYRLKECLCCCRQFFDAGICCSHVQKPKKSTKPFLFSTSVFGRAIDARYTLICCVFPCCRTCRDDGDFDFDDDDDDDDDEEEEEDEDEDEDEEDCW